ncbi:MAG: Gfo/Idh/MocA family oxidoreductase [Ferruginibacter sp.]
MDKIINVGLIGFGIGGQIFHAPFISGVKGLNLAKIRAAKEAQVASASEHYPNAQIVPQTEDILNDDSIGLVVISTPNTSHHPLAKAAILAGKHVVLDKPFTLNTVEADELIALAVEHGKILTVYHSRRFDSDFRTVQKLLKNGLLGTLVEFESHYDRFRNFFKPGAWREEDQPGAGILFDLGSHLIDQALVLFGLPESVYADLRIQRKDARVTDNFDLVLNYPGLKVTLKAGMLVREALPRFTLLGDQGSFIKYGLDVQEEALKKGHNPISHSTGWGVEPIAIWGKLNTDINGIHFVGNIESETGNYTSFYQNVYDVIVKKAELFVKPTEARNTMRIIELAVQSNVEKAVVPYSFK